MLPVCTGMGLPENCHSGFQGLCTAGLGLSGSRIGVAWEQVRVQVSVQI